MSVPHPARLLRIHIGESDHWHGVRLHTAIVERLRREGIAGATVIHGVEGYGGHSIVHAAHILDLSSDLPVIIEVIDSPERIDAILPVVTAIVSEGLIYTLDITVVYQSSGDRP
jgi:PII-like signaling protein